MYRNVALRFHMRPDLGFRIECPYCGKINDEVQIISAESLTLNQITKRNTWDFQN